MDDKRVQQGIEKSRGLDKIIPIGSQENVSLRFLCDKYYEEKKQKAEQFPEILNLFYYMLDNTQVFIKTF